MRPVLLLIIGVVFAASVLAMAISKEPQNQEQDTKPDDFIQVTRDISKGIYYNFETLSEDYYRHPEFYPSYKRYLESKKEHDYNRWGVHGYGAYPGEISYSVKNMTAGQQIQTTTIVRTGYDIETYQGLKFVMRGHSDLFERHITPDNILLTPTFPEFTDGWAQKIKIHLVATKDIPEGNYIFTLVADRPDDEIQAKYYRTVQEYNQKHYDCAIANVDCTVAELRKKVYVSGGMISPENFFKLIITATS